MEQDEVKVAIDRLKLILKDFSMIVDRKHAEYSVAKLSCSSIEREQFPSPQSLLFLLRGILGLPEDGTYEKTHWQVSFTFKNLKCSIAHQKFGLKLYLPNDCDILATTNTLLGKLKKAMVFAEQNILSKIAEAQISAGNITIANRFNQLDGQYRHFRETAKANFELKVEFQETPNPLGGMLSKYLNAISTKKKVGSFNSLAMIDAFFSRLEHFLVISLVFCWFDRDKDDLKKFVGYNWSKKLDRIIDVKDKESQKYRFKLVAIKEKYRNTFAHGGFEKNGASFYFHLGNFGAMPANMSDFRNSVHFNLLPIDHDSFEDICTLFDEVDEWLCKRRLPFAWKFAESGLDLNFDEESIQQMLLSMDTLSKFDQWMKHQSYLQDMYANADY